MLSAHGRKMQGPGTRLQGLSDILLIDYKKVNPYAEQAQYIARRHCIEAGIYLEGFESYTTMCGYLYPSTSPKRLMALILINNFLYYVDEVWERHEREDASAEERKEENLYLREVFDHCVRIMLTGEMPGNSQHELYDASLMIHKFVTPLTNQSWLESFILVTLQHLKSTTYTLEDIMKSGGDPIERYIGLRLLDSGMRPTIWMIEFANNSYLPDVIKQHPFIQSVQEPTMHIAGLMNDIISYEKEVIKYGSRFNLVALLEDYMSFEEAVDMAVEIVNQFTRDFLACEKAMPDFGNARINQMVKRYVQGLRDQITATWYWQLSTDRYRSATSPFPELRQPVNGDNDGTREAMVL